jgi:hypothetical protein
MSNEPFTLDQAAIRHDAAEFRHRLQAAGSPFGDVPAAHWENVIREYAVTRDFPAGVTGVDVLAAYLDDRLAGRNTG